MEGREQYRETTKSSKETGLFSAIALVDHSLKGEGVLAALCTSTTFTVHFFKLRGAEELVALNDPLSPLLST